MRSPDTEAVAALRSAGLLEEGDDARPTRRWHAAMARAAARLQESGAPWTDLRLPIASALLEVAPADDETLVRYVEAMLEAELRSIAPPRTAGASPAP